MNRLTAYAARFLHPAETKHSDRAPVTSATCPYDHDLLDQIKRIGFHPFILVRIGKADFSGRQFVICPTQNEAAKFVGDLAKLPHFAESKLIRAIERALQLETYEAADLLFGWACEPAAPATEIAYVGIAEREACPLFYDYPAFQLTQGTSICPPELRIESLRQLFDAYATAAGNDALRFAVMEALAFGLSRALGHGGSYGEALAIVDRALVVRPYSIHLKAAKHALGLRLAGGKVPPRLEKFIGTDSGYLKQFVCPLPFERFDIGPDGNVMVCCGHWLPTHIGNFMNDPLDGVLNSARAQKIRESVTDGSYKYCNHLECGTMAQDTLPNRDELDRPRTREAVARGDWRLDGVDQVMFAFDQSCNLSCPSCRTHRIVEKLSESTEKARAVEEKLLPLLPKIRTLFINPAGELFASKPSRKLLELINDERCPDLKLDIISNGTLFSEEEWNKFPGIHGKVKSVRISTDAACKETFEKLRRLGKYDVFLENMRFLSRLRATGAIPQLKFSFTYQLDNFREMRAFVEFCARMNADFTIFERLQNIAFTHEEYRRKAVHYPDHPLYGEFIEVIKDPIFRAKQVWHDFDYPGVEKMSAEEARSRLREVPNTALPSQPVAAAQPAA
jgi:Iron-sulfur cluster-binding domain